MIAGAAAHAQNVVSIKGQLAVNRQGMVRINYTSGSLYVEDSAQVKNGAFVLKGTVGDPVKAMLSFYAAGTNRNQQVTSNAEWKELYLEKGAVWIESNAGLKEAVIKGGKTQNDYAGWAAQHKVLDDQLSRIGARAMEYKMSMNDTGMQGIRNRSMPLVQQKKKIDSVFIKTPFEKGFKKMEVDAINEKNEYNMKISDPKYYRKIKKDTIIIKVGNKIEKYVMINNKK